MSISSVIVLVAIGGATLAFLGRWAARLPYRARNIPRAGIGSLLEAVLRRGYDGGLMIIEVRERRGDQRFVQFRKYIRPGREIGLQYGFPSSRWSAKYWAQLLETLKRHSIQFDVIETGRTDTSAFVCVDVGTDIQRAVQLTDVTLTVLGVPESARLDVLLAHGSPRDELIDTLPAGSARASRYSR
jgi:hypothetical protein